jgi:hypothetical protein
VNELVAPDSDRHVGGAGRLRREEQQVSGRQVIFSNGSARQDLFFDRAWNRDPMLSEDVMNQPAAIEAGHIGAAKPVRGPAQGQRRPDDRVADALAERGRHFGRKSAFDGRGRWCSGR